MIKFALTGVHGSGKTTLLLKIEKELTERDITCVCVNEVARECPFQTGMETTFDAQTWIFTEQLRRELIAMDTGAQVILCDRTLLDNMMYMRRFVDHEDSPFDVHMKTMRVMHQIAMNWMSTYDQVIRLELNIEWLLGRDGGKDTAVDIVGFANEIEYRFGYSSNMYVDYTYKTPPPASRMADLIMSMVDR
jgi:thymidylate kinase